MRSRPEPDPRTLESAHGPGRTWRDGKTIVRFSHRRWLMESDFLRFCSLKWATFLLSLKHSVEAGRGEPWPRDVET